MKILQINCVYKVGSTGKIVDSIGQVLRAQGHDVFTCYGVGDDYYDDYSQKICSNFEHKVNALLSRVRGIPYGGIYFSNSRLVKTIRQYHPDVVHVHCINGNMINVYKFFKFLGRTGIRTVVTLHAEIYHTAGCEHALDCEKFKTQCANCEQYKRKIGSFFFERSRAAWTLMNKAFSFFEYNNLIVTAVSPWLADRAKQSTILRNRRIECVPNGVDTKTFHYRADTSLIDKEHYKRVVLFVTAYFGTEEDDLKGGRYLLQIANRMPHCKFVVVATRIANDIKELPFNVQIWGRAKDQNELSQLYSEADVSILLSRRETFSMVTAESLCCGTSVVGFKAGGPESIAMDNYSVFVEYGNVAKIVSEIGKIKTNNKEQLSKLATNIYSKERIAKKLLSCYNDLQCDYFTT